MALNLGNYNLKRVLIKVFPAITVKSILDEVSCKLADKPFCCCWLIKCSMCGLIYSEKWHDRSAWAFSQFITVSSNVFNVLRDSFFTGNCWTSSSDAESPWISGLCLFTLGEKEDFFKDSGKTAKLKKRTEQLSNDNFNDNISCLNESNFFVCSSHLWN